MSSPSVKARASSRRLARSAAAPSWTRTEREIGAEARLEERRVRRVRAGGRRPRAPIALAAAGEAGAACAPGASGAADGAAFARATPPACVFSSSVSTAASFRCDHGGRPMRITRSAMRSAAVSAGSCAPPIESDRPPLARLCLAVRAGWPTAAAARRAANRGLASPRSPPDLSAGPWLPPLSDRLVEEGLRPSS